MLNSEISGMLVDNVTDLCGRDFLVRQKHSHKIHAFPHTKLSMERRLQFRYVI